MKIFLFRIPKVVIICINFFEYLTWVPFIGTMFLFIFVSNWSGALVPWKIIELPSGELGARVMYF